MSIAHNVHQVQKEIETMRTTLSDLEIVDWDEIFEFVPNSEQIHQEIKAAIEKLVNSVSIINKLVQ